MKKLVFALILIILLSACAPTNTGIDEVNPLINPSIVSPKYGESGYKLQIVPIGFEEIPYDLSNSYVAYFAMYEIEPGQLTFTRIFVGSNFEGKQSVHYFKVIPVQVETGPVTAFDENAYEAMLKLSLAISKSK
jgi:hypothetical protein